jgi:cytochrome c
VDVFDPVVVLRVGSILALASLAACGGASSAPAPSPAARRGEAVFMQNCAHCHVVQSSKWRDAPSLRNILGRKAGSTSFPYSPAFRHLDFVWTRESLDKYLADPRKTVPGNEMAFFGMPDPAARADLIAYLALMSPSASQQ